VIWTDHLTLETARRANPMRTSALIVASIGDNNPWKERSQICRTSVDPVGMAAVTPQVARMTHSPMGSGAVLRVAHRGEEAGRGKCGLLGGLLRSCAWAGVGHLNGDVRGSGYQRLMTAADPAPIGPADPSASLWPCCNERPGAGRAEWTNSGRFKRGSSRQTQTDAGSRRLRTLHTYLPCAMDPKQALRWLRMHGVTPAMPSFSVFLGTLPSHAL